LRMEFSVREMDVLGCLIFVRGAMDCGGGDTGNQRKKLLLCQQDNFPPAELTSWILSKMRTTSMVSSRKSQKRIVAIVQKKWDLGQRLQWALTGDWPRRSERRARPRQGTKRA
jgi:hypothetical protein